MKCNLIPQVTNRMLVALTVLLLSSQVVFSQAIIAPVQADQTMVSGVNNVQWLNNSTFSGVVVSGTHRLVATTWQAGSVCAVNIYNGSSSFTQTIPVPAGYSSVARPDVAIGGASAVNQQAYAAVVYTARGNGIPDQVFMTIYRCSVNVSNIVVLTGIKPSIPISSSATGVVTAHIDLVYKESGPNMIARDFFIAWEDNDFTVGGVIGANACRGNIITQFGSGSIPASDYLSFSFPSGVNGAGNGARYVDVAGYERNMNGDNFAVFTYVDDNRMELYSRIWRSTTNVLDPPVSVDQGKLYTYPRVDAKDPRSQAGVGISDFEIVYETPGPIGGNAVFGRADGHPINPITIAASNPLVSPDNNTRPTVACGLGGRYGVVFWANMAGARNILFQDLLWTNGAFASLTPDYRQVNMTSGAGPNLVTIANTWNYNAGPGTYDPLRNYISWYDPAGAKIKFKFYSSILAGMFKTTKDEPSEGVANTYIEELKPGGEFSIAPVPAENEIYIQSNGDELSKRYSIADMTGKVVLSGGITSYKERIDISQIAKGVYILTVDEKTVRIVKQ